MSTHAELAIEFCICCKNPEITPAGSHIRTCPYPGIIALLGLVALEEAKWWDKHGGFAPGGRERIAELESKWRLRTWT